MWDPREVVAVVNPAAGSGRVGRRWSTLEPALRERLGPIQFRLTEHADHASALAADAVAAGARTVLSLGGDGTHGAVVDGIMSTNSPPGAVALGLLPAGTGGDLCRVVSTGRELLPAAERMPAAKSTLIDVGHVSHALPGGGDAQRHFVNVSAVGISGLVDRLVSRSSKRLGGTVTFYLATLRALAVYRPAALRLVLDGFDLGTHSVTNVVVCNSRYAGGGMLFAPDARLDDGLLDVVVFRHVSAATTIAMSRQIYAGTHAEAPTVSVHRGAVLSVEPVGPEPVWLDTDGEVPGIAPVRYTVRPKAIRLLGLSA